MKIWKFFAVAGAVVTIGGAVFFFTRPAAAAAAGKKAFKVDDKCTTIEIVDQDAAKSALVSAATFHFKGVDQKAIDLLILALGQAIPQCPINDYMKIVGLPGTIFDPTVGQIRAVIGDMTIGEVQELAAKGELPGVPGLDMSSDPLYMDSVESTHANPVSAILAWTTGGEYP